MYCIHCGKEIPDSAAFCVYCGKQQTASNSNKQDTHFMSEAGKESPRTNRKHGIIYWIIQIAVVFLLIGCVWYYFTGQDEPQSTGLFESIEQNADDNTIYVDEQVVPVSEYFSNPVNFMNQYQGKRIAFDFTSMPESIDSEKVTFHVIADDYDNFFLWCYSDSTTISSISTDNYYGIVGTVESNNEWSLSMVDCEFILAN